MTTLHSLGRGQIFSGLDCGGVRVGVTKRLSATYNHDPARKGLRWASLRWLRRLVLPATAELRSPSGRGPERIKQSDEFARRLSQSTTIAAARRHGRCNTS